MKKSIDNASKFMALLFFEGLFIGLFVGIALTIVYLFIGGKL